MFPHYPKGGNGCRLTGLKVINIRYFSSKTKEKQMKNSKKTDNIIPKGITRKQLTDVLFKGFTDIEDSLTENDYSVFRSGMNSITLIDRRNGNQFEISVIQM